MSLDPQLPTVFPRPQERVDPRHDGRGDERGRMRADARSDRRDVGSLSREVGAMRQEARAPRERATALDARVGRGPTAPRPHLDGVVECPRDGTWLLADWVDCLDRVGARLTDALIAARREPGALLRLAAIDLDPHGRAGAAG